MFCSQCGHEIPSESQFCNHCGRKIISQPIPPPPPPPQPQTCRQNNNMAGHLQVVAWLNITLAALGLLTGIGLFGFFSALGAGLPYMTHISYPANHFPFGAFFPGLGALMMGAIAILAVPQLIGGVGLLKRHTWARVLIIIISILNLLHFPFGTILGIYSLWVLFSCEGQKLFQGQSESKIVIN
jgi:hypothetical protein